jgi:hypothetical protein
MSCLGRCWVKLISGWRGAALVRIWLPYHIRRSAGLAARGSTSGSRERPSARHFHRRFGNRVFINRSPGCKHHAGGNSREPPAWSAFRSRSRRSKCSEVIGQAPKQLPSRLIYSLLSVQRRFSVLGYCAEATCSFSPGLTSSGRTTMIPANL